MAVAARVDAALAGFFDRAAPALEAAGSELVEVSAAAREFVLTGGKRMRPVFAYWGWRCVHHAAAPGEGAVISTAAGLELLHAAALVHDDLIDDSETRRGHPAAHAQFAQLPGLAGRPDPGFGAASAILLGDLLLSWSWSLVATSVRDNPHGAGVLAAFDAMCTEMMAGQYLDVLEQARGGHSVETALRVARFKSSKYTVERPLHIGAAAAGAPAGIMASLSDFGVPLGEAFQLRDDILGVFGDPARTGKPAGDDLREGKRTVLVALAHSQADAAQRDLLDRGLGRADLDDAGADELRAVIVGSGALDEVEQMIADRTKVAQDALDGAVIRPDARAALATLATAATQRSY